MNFLSKKLIISILCLFVAACKSDVKDIIDKTAVAEKAPVFTPDSPMWRKLSSPASVGYKDGVFRTEKEDLYHCALIRTDTLRDNLPMDNNSLLYMVGTIDSQTTSSGYYNAEFDGWYITKSDQTPRYSPILLGPIGFFEGGQTRYKIFFGGGYAANEDFPSGVNLIKDWWLKSDYNQSGDIVGHTILSGFVVNNVGYYIENDKNKQMWSIDNGSVYNKILPFDGNFYGKFLTTSAKTKRGNFGFLLAESTDESIKTKEFYEYNAKEKQWTRKADFLGEDRIEGVLFSIKNNVYYGLGQSKIQAKGFRDIWEYNTENNKWELFATYPGSGNIKVAAASVAGKVYIGLGYYVGQTPIKTEKYIGVSDFWEFVPSRK